MKATTEKLISVALIGQPRGFEFTSLLAFLRHHPVVKIVGEYSGIDHAIHAGLAETTPADMVAVLQEFSDQYSLQESSQLIGRMMFGRVFCCYGPWCQADGRSHDIWPVSTRIAVASAEFIISRELEAFAAGMPPLSPMSAAEEVFVHRISAAGSPDQRPRGAAIIISGERPLRDTVKWFCRDCGLDARPLPMSKNAVRDALEQRTFRPDVAILDLDPPDQFVADVLSELRLADPGLPVLGMSVFPQESFNVGKLNAILDKTELQTQLKWHVSRQSRN